MKLMNWRGGTWFDKPGIRFDVVEEDGIPVEKQFTVSSRGLVQTLKPLLLKAEEAGRDCISVRIMRTGEGFDTSYTVEEAEEDPDG